MIGAPGLIDGETYHFKRGKELHDFLFIPSLQCAVHHVSKKSKGRNSKLSNSAFEQILKTLGIEKSTKQIVDVDINLANVISNETGNFDGLEELQDLYKLEVSPLWYAMMKVQELYFSIIQDK